MSKEIVEIAVCLAADKATKGILCIDSEQVTPGVFALPPNNVSHYFEISRSKVLAALGIDLSAKDAEIKELHETIDEIMLKASDELVEIAYNKSEKEIKRLEQGWMKLCCITRAWDTQADQDDQPCEFDCQHIRQGTDYCQAVLDVVRGDLNEA